ncbi:hypothetical protein NDU88_003669 [Pleurodeles waltl]|uniref:Uncharacterized protein n=1 Tax=Pleurodeles waltl TaxID=8319 RepID=A0AAV7MR82_PLEWA|nr:hypothetical protein NDU88_003669 [Pleurodeles waltl]
MHGAVFRGTFQDPEAASQDDGPDIREEQAKGDAATWPEEEESSTETPEQKNPSEPPERGEGTPTRKTPSPEENLHRALHNARHSPGGTWLSQFGCSTFVSGCRIQGNPSSGPRIISLRVLLSTFRRLVFLGFLPKTNIFSFGHLLTGLTSL